MDVEYMVFEDEGHGYTMGQQNDKAKYSHYTIKA
jgi:hypothetical protein